MTPSKEGKRIKRALRTIPTESIGPTIAEEESHDRSGLWCLVDDVVEWIRADGVGTTTEWEDPSGLVYAQMARWLRSHPERVHLTDESAVEFVRRKIVGE